MKPVDIFITTYLRQEFTRNTLRYLKERTRYPHRVFLLDNGGNEEFKNGVDYYIGMSKNLGIHAAWNMALSLAESEYFITSDNDIYVPDVQPDWLEWLVGFMELAPQYGAISLHPHVLIGAASFDPNDPEDVKEVNMAGAVMRIMPTELIRTIGGWDHKIDPKRNHEERTLASRLHAAGYKTGRTTKIRAYHPFKTDKGNNWGYPQEITPQMHGHTPELSDYVAQFDQIDSYDHKTWLPKT